MFALTYITRSILPIITAQCLCTHTLRLSRFTTHSSCSSHSFIPPLLTVRANMSTNIPVLSNVDPELADIVEMEMARQYRGLEMIASENFTSAAVLECLGSALTNKYAEGLPGSRYYGGTEYVDKVENLARTRALNAFHLNPDEWGVNVQPYSGSPANFAVYTAFLQPHDRIMGLDLPSGGHLTHGYYTAKKRISATSIYFESYPYKVNADGVIDYDNLEATAETYRPKMIIMGASAYARDYDYERVRALCDNIGAYLFMDMAHTAGLIAPGLLKSPFPYCDMVSTTTHKTLRGPRAGMIFFRKTDRHGKPTDFESRVNNAVFPTLQGGPHMHQIAAIAAQMKEVAEPAWKEYATQIIRNCKVLSDGLLARGHKIVSGGTDNHLILWNVRELDITGSKMEKLLEAISISGNKNTIPGDKSAMTPGGVRLGVAALTSRGLKEEDMKTVVDLLDRAAKLALEVQASSQSSKLIDFVEAMKKSDKVQEMRREVESFAVKFAMPGFDTQSMKYKEGLPQVEK